MKELINVKSGINELENINTYGKKINETETETYFLFLKSTKVTRLSGKWTREKERGLKLLQSRMRD